MIYGTIDYFPPHWGERQRTKAQERVVAWWHAGGVCARPGCDCGLPAYKSPTP